MSGLFKIDSNKLTKAITEESLSEKDLEELIEKNPEIILESGLLIIGRQVPTDYGLKIDLLAVTANGNTVIIELKKDKTPRDVISQILEYAVFIEKLGYEDLNKITNDYSKGSNLRSLYTDYFAEGSLDNILENVNQQQLLIIVAKEVEERTEDLARYLRERGVNLRVLKYTYFSTVQGEKYLHMETIVGKEAMKAVSSIDESPIPDFYELLDKVVEKLPYAEFSAPEAYDKFRQVFPEQFTRLQEKYKGNFTAKNYIALALVAYSKRPAASFSLTDRFADAPKDWGYPKVKVFRRKGKQLP